MTGTKGTLLASCEFEVAWEIFTELEIFSFWLLAECLGSLELDWEVLTGISFWTDKFFFSALTILELGSMEALVAFWGCDSLPSFCSVEEGPVFSVAPVLVIAIGLEETIGGVEVLDKRFWFPTIELVALATRALVFFFSSFILSLEIEETDESMLVLVSSCFTELFPCSSKVFCDLSFTFFSSFSLEEFSSSLFKQLSSISLSISIIL